MALTWDDVSGKTNAHIVPILTDNVFKASPLFTRLRTRNAARFPGGTTIKHNIMYAKLKGGPFTRGSAFDVSYVQTDTALEFNIKAYYVNVTIFGLDNILNRGPEAVMSHVESKLVNAAGTMAENLAIDTFLDGQGTNSSSIALDGLQAAVDDGTNFASYGGITRTDIATGANQGINGYFATVATLSLAAVQTAYGATWFGNERADLLVTTQAVWDIFWNKLQPQQRFQEESSDVAKIGFQSLRFNGASLTVDQYAPTGKLWLLNTKYIYFYISDDQKFQFGFTGWKEAQQTIDVAGQYLYAGNIVLAAPRLNGQISGITG